MRLTKLFAQIGLLLMFAVSTSLVSAQTQTELALPSLSIFGFPLPSSPENKKLDQPFSAAELESILDEGNRVKKDYPNAKTPPGEKKATFIIPLAFYRSRHLFKPQVWTDADIKEGQLISNFFARLTEQTELEIKATDQESFGRGLQNLRNWFVGLTQANETLGAMMFTFDDGPFVGQKVDETKFLEWKRLSSVIISGTNAKFVLMTDNRAPEPMIIGVMNADNSLLWARRYSDETVGDGHLSNAQLVKRAPTPLEDYGCKLVMSTGGEASVVYLEENLALRFYYVSW